MTYEKCYQRKTTKPFACEATYKHSKLATFTSATNKFGFPHQAFSIKFSVLKKQEGQEGLLSLLELNEKTVIAD